MRSLRSSALVVLILLTAACDRDPLLGPSELRGEWRLVHQAQEGHTEHRLTFGADGKYRSELRWYGFHGHTSTVVTGYATTTGAYRLEGDELLLRIVRSEEWQMYAVGPNPSVQKVLAPRWARAATVELQGDELYYTFVSAPLDVPVVTTAVYQRLR
jgi:hypothetical protein